MTPDVQIGQIGASSHTWKPSDKLLTTISPPRRVEGRNFEKIMDPVVQIVQFGSLSHIWMSRSIFSTILTPGKKVEK